MKIAKTCTPEMFQKIRNILGIPDHPAFTITKMKFTLAVDSAIEVEQTFLVAEIE